MSKRTQRSPAKRVTNPFSFPPDAQADPNGQPNSELAGSNEPSFEMRKRFTCFDADDAALMRALRPTFERHADEIVEQFYDHLQAYEPMRQMLRDDRVLRRLRRAQRDYLMRLTSGRYGESYARSRLTIGRVHERIGLDPQWYLGTYGFYIGLLQPLVQEHFRDDPPAGDRAVSALTKLLILDMQVALDAYYETRQRKALERSEQLAAVGALAASIAHEVRNPLAGMKGALEVLRGEFASKPSNLEIVDEVLAQIVRLEGLVRDLLTFAHPRVISRQAIDLHEMLDRILRLFQEEADRLGITIHRIYGPGTGTLMVDLEQMEQVLLNLIHNALQAMEDGGKLTVSTRLDKERLVLQLQDSGQGILPADLPRIFQPFFTTKHRGSGLGLAIVKKIVEAHGGSVEVESELGRGTRVTVLLGR